MQQGRVGATARAEAAQRELRPPIKQTVMASYNKFDPRLESLVMETRTLWDPEVANLSDEDKHWLAEQVLAVARGHARYETPSP